MKEEEATSEAVKDFFTNLAMLCMEHKNRKTGKKFLFVPFYSGHGWIKAGTQRVTLHDAGPFDPFPLEL